MHPEHQKTARQIVINMGSLGVHAKPCKRETNITPHSRCVHNGAAPQATPSQCTFLLQQQISTGAQKKLRSIILVMILYVVSNRDGCLHLYIYLFLIIYFVYFIFSTHGQMSAVRMSAVLSP